MKKREFCSLLQNGGNEATKTALSFSAMSTSASFAFASKAHSHGSGLNNHPRRKFRARTTQPPTASASSDPIFFTNSSQSCFVFGQISSCPSITQSNIDAQSDAEEIQPGVAEEKGSTISPSMEEKGISSNTEEFQPGVAEEKGSTISTSMEEKGISTNTEEVQPGVAEEKGSTISTSMDTLVLSEIKETNQESTTNSLVIVSRILKGIPQSPHFYQLRNHSDYARTFMISAWDRIFEQVFEQIKSLQANDHFWVNCRELWRTMEELQTMGYNVIPLRRRIVELSDVIREVKLSKLEMKRLKMKAENHRAEKSRLEFVILKLQDMIREEEEGMERAMNQVAEMEKDLPKIDAIFAKICSREPLIV